MAKKQKTKVTGGMDRDWISQVRASKETTSLVRKASNKVKRQSEADMRVYNERHGYGYRYFYGSVQKKSKQGTTFIMWPTNWLSSTDPEPVRKNIDNGGLEPASEAKSKRGK